MKNSSQRYFSFEDVDVSLDHLGLSKDEKKHVYAVLSSILNLGNIEFETTDDEQCCVTRESEMFLNNAAQLLDIDKLILKDALTSYSREIGKQHIK